MLLQNAYSKLSFAPSTLGLSSQTLTEQHTHLAVGKPHFIGKLVLGCHMPTYSWHSVLLTLSQTPFYWEGAYFTLKVTGLPHPTLPTKRHISFPGNVWPDARILKTPANLGMTLWELFFIFSTWPFWFRVFVCSEISKINFIFWKTESGLQPNCKGLRWKCQDEKGSSLEVSLELGHGSTKDKLSESGQVTANQNLMFLSVN